MRHEIKIDRERECCSLIPDICYATVPGWFSASVRNLKMDILAPKNCAGHEPLPAIVWICGGSFYDMDKAVWIPQLVHLAAKGYVVCSVEYRTSNHASFPAPLQDIKSAIRYIRAHADTYVIDPDRIVVMGESAGGALAALTGVTGDLSEYEQGEWLEYSSSVQAIVDFYGIADMALAVEQIRPASHLLDAPWLLDAFLGAHHTEETIRRASAVANIAENTPPTLILHGTQDIMVPLEQSQRFYDALVGAGVPAEFYVIEGAVHGDDLFYQDNVLDIVDRALQKWLSKNNDF